MKGLFIRNWRLIIAWFITIASQTMILFTGSAIDMQIVILCDMMGISAIILFALTLKEIVFKEDN